MKKIIILTLFSLFFIATSDAHAAEVIDTPSPVTMPSAPLLITAYQTSHSTHFVQIYNNSDAPFSLDGWLVEALLRDGTQETEQSLASLSGWIAPRDYILVGDGGIDGSDINFVNPAPASNQSVVKIILKHNQFTPQELTPAAHLPNEFMQRNKTASGAFSTAAQPFSKADLATAQIYGHGYYEFLDETQLQIVEILPNARDCSPAEVSNTCTDYIKIYNPTDQTIVLDDFRLRSGYQGQSSSVSNSFSLNGDIAPGQYITVNLRNDNTPISLTNTGGFVWVENIYGLVRYDNTIIEYPDASAAKNKGVSWAYDNVEGIWKWGVPSPGAENIFPVATEEAGKGGSTSTLKPCRSDQFRNPATNRCKLVSSTTSTLKPCAANQYRNSETNRCRLISSTSSTLKPCDPGQFRNPETNRCKKISSSTSSLKPCKPNQERNPETNRCRKVIKNTAVAGAVDEIPQEEKTSMKNMTPWLIGLAGGGVALYGLYEWRTEIMEATLRLRDVFGKGGGPPNV